MPVTYQPTKLRGRVLMAREDRPDQLLAIGNVGPLSQSNEVDAQSVPDYTNPSGGEWARVETLTAVSLSGTLYDLDHVNIARALRASDTEVPGATITGEAHTAYQGAQIKTAHPQPSAVTITNAAGAWAAETDYALGAFAVPGTPNGHVYKVTTAGTSDTTEPVAWPEDGSTVTDGTVTWTDMGTFAAVSGTDFEVRPAGVMISPGGGIPDGCPVALGYTHPAYQQIEPMQAGGVYYRLVFEGLNAPNTDQQIVIEYYRAEPSLAESLELIADGMTTIPFSVRCLADSTLGQGRSSIYSIQQV